MITPGQCRAARALLRWSQEDLAARCEAGITAIRTFEAETASPRRSTIAVIARALEESGVAFIPAGEGAGPGVRLKRAD